MYANILTTGKVHRRFFYSNEASSRPLLGLTVHAVVMDGVTLGRPTCGVPHCTLPLANKLHRFCHSHLYFDHKCAIVGCNERTSAPAKQTCKNPTHQRVEVLHVEHGGAVFQLKERLIRAKVAHPKHGEALDVDK